MTTTVWSVCPRCGSREFSTPRLLESVIKHGQKHHTYTTRCAQGHVTFFRVDERTTVDADRPTCFTTHPAPTTSRGASMSQHEPPGHRGHPTSGEQYRAKGTAARLDVALDTLAREGFSRGEAVAFIAGVCQEVARERGLEAWFNVSGARITILNLLDGGAARHWSLDVIDISLASVHDLLGAS